MATKYQVIFKDGKTKPITNLSFDEILQYRIDNINNSENFVCSEIVKKSREKKESDNEAESYSMFKKSLSTNQLHLIERGERRIRKSKEIGYYLEVVHKETEFFSLNTLDKNKKLKEDVIKSIKDNSNIIFESIQKTDPNVNLIDILKLLEDLVFVSKIK